MVQLFSVQTPYSFAFKDERAEGKAIVRVHILDPAALATSSQALISFWPYSNVRAGHVTLIELITSFLYLFMSVVVGLVPL